VAGRHAAPDTRLEWQTRRGRALRTLGMNPCQLLLGCRRDGLSDRQTPQAGQESDRRLPAACGRCLPGSEPREVWMVRRRSTVRFRKGALGHELGRRRLTCANMVGRRLGVLRLAAAETGLLRLVVPNTCPSLSRPAQVRVACLAPGSPESRGSPN
jgi:hypothetical protein